MEWWQVLLMFVASLAIGVLIGALVYYLPKQLAKRREMASMTREQEVDESVIEPVIEEQVIEEPVIKEPVSQEPVIEEPVSQEPVIEEPVSQEPVIEEPVIKEPASQEPVIEEPVIKEPATKKRVKVALPGLLEEIVNNRRIATTPWEGKLLPFQTTTWETLQDNVNKVPANIHDDLAQIYIDIRLANSIVRLATDFNRRSGSLDESYKKLCIGIAEKINRIKPQIE